MLLAAGGWPKARKSSPGNPRTIDSWRCQNVQIKPRMQQNTKIKGTGIAPLHKQQESTNPMFMFFCENLPGAASAL